MKFDVLNRFSGEVQFTADIDCDESELQSVKLGLAVKWAVANNENLSEAALREAALREAALREADLSGADLHGADLREADLREADLREADLREADLREADLREADLSLANLSLANLRWASGNNKEITTIQSGTYVITICGDVMAIGCQQRKVDEWMSFDDSTISKMDHGALDWWRVWKPIIQQILEARP